MLWQGGRVRPREIDSAAAEFSSAALSLPAGIITTDDCSWRRILEHWPEPLASITDAGDPLHNPVLRVPSEELRGNAGVFAG